MVFCHAHTKALAQNDYHVVVYVALWEQIQRFISLKLIKYLPITDKLFILDHFMINLLGLDEKTARIVSDSHTLAVLRKWPYRVR